jgi:hypothetical protein
MRRRERDSLTKRAESVVSESIFGEMLEKALSVFEAHGIERALECLTWRMDGIVAMNTQVPWG